MATVGGRRSKKLLAPLVSVLVGVLLFGTSAPAAANPFVDVPPGHWAYTALERLGAAALIDGYAPGFFTGARRLTRYEMALSVAGALARLRGDDTLLAAADEYDLDALIASYNAREPVRPLTTADEAVLRAMVVEFSDELAMLGYAVPNVSHPAVGAEDAGDGMGYVVDAAFVSMARQRLSSGDGEAPRRLDDDSLMPVSDLRIGERAPAAQLAQRVLAGSSVDRLDSVGSGMLFSETHPATLDVRTWGQASLLGPNGSTHMLQYPLPGSFLSELSGTTDAALFWPSTEKRVAVEGITVTPYLSLAGERAERSSLEADASATSVRATVQLGRDVALAGNVRAVESGFDQVDGEAYGVGLWVRLGDVVLSTERDIVQRTEAADEEKVTTWALEYSLAEQARVQAGWQTVSDTRSRASVDVNVPIPLGALRLGLAYEGNRTGESGISMTTLTIAGLDLQVAENAAATAAFSMQEGNTTGRAASLGVRYTLSPEAALTVGYKWINFTGDKAEERPENVTTAEVTIRF